MERRPLLDSWLAFRFEPFRSKMFERLPCSMQEPTTPNHNKPAPFLADCETIADLLAISQKTVRKWTREGKLPCVRLSRRCVRWPISDCLAIVNEHRINAISEV